MVDIEKYRRKPTIDIEKYRRKEIDKSYENDENLLQKFVHYGLKRPLASALHFAHDAGNIPHNIGHMLGTDAIPKQPNINWDEFVGLPKEKTIGDEVINFAPNILAAIATPELQLGRVGAAVGKSLPRAGKYINKIIAQGIPQAAVSGLMSDPEDAAKNAAATFGMMAPFSALSVLAKSPNSWMRRAAKTGSGLLGALAGKELGKGIGASNTTQDILGAGLGALGYRGFHSNKDIQNKFAKGASPEKVKPKLDASRRLGIDYLTPAETLSDPFLAAKEGSVGRTEEGSKLMYDKAQSRSKSEERAIQKFLDTIYEDEVHRPVEDIMYESLKPLHLPESFESQFKDNEIIKRARNIVEKNPAYKESLKKYSPQNLENKNDPLSAFKDAISKATGESIQEKTEAPNTSLIYWDHVKGALDKMVNKAKKNGSDREARIISETRKSLRDAIDEHHPSYKDARALAERRLTRAEIEHIFDKKEMNAQNMYKIIHDDAKFDKIIKHLRNVPAAQQMLRDMKFVFKDMIPPPSVRTAAALERTSMNKERNPIQALGNIFEHMFTKGRGDKEAIEFITSPNWDKMIKDIEKISDKQKRASKAIELIGKGLSQVPVAMNADND